MRQGQMVTALLSLEEWLQGKEAAASSLQQHCPACWLAFNGC